MSISTVEITIPSTSLVTIPKSYTVYHVSLRLPLRSFTIQKRYSDFAIFQKAIRSQADAPPPNPLPPKSFFSSTVHNAALTESRRAGLESYLQAINESSDSRWRDTPAWQTFLNLPNTLSAKSKTVTTLRSAGDRTIGLEASDPVIWLDVHRELRGVLQEARRHIASKDQMDNTTASHEEAAAANKALLRAGTLIASLDSGLKVKMEAWGAETLGEGEVYRRRDLVASARKEKDDLERLLNAIVKKTHLDQVVESNTHRPPTVGSPDTVRAKIGGRVLGKESEKTMKLDNDEVLQLQKQMMEEQDMNVETVGDAIRRQKELAIQINEELSVQNELLGMLDEDVTRTEAKIEVARRRADQIT